MLCSFNEVLVWFTGDFLILDKRLLLCWNLICIRITYSPLHLDINVCTSIVLHIDVYKEMFCIFHYFIFTLIFKEIYTYSASNKPGLSEIYPIKITCHRIIIILLLVASNDVVNKMLPWTDHYVYSQDSSYHSGFGYAERFAGLCQIHLPAFTEEIFERMALDHPDYLSVFLI